MKWDRVHSNINLYFRQQHDQSFVFVTYYSFEVTSFSSATFLTVNFMIFLFDEHPEKMVYLEKQKEEDEKDTNR
jgi:hypothetical protein